MVSKATIWISGIAIALGLFVLLVERHLDSTREALHRARFLTLLEAGEISTVRVSSPGHRAVLERGEESWHLVSPLQDVADPEKLEHLLKQLCQLPLVEALAPAGVSEETLGFSKSNVIEVELEASGSEPRRILLGRSGPFDGTIYAKADTGPQAGRPCLVRFEGRGELASPLERLRDRRLLRVHPGAIRGYRLRTKAGEIVLRREEREPKWHIESPLQTRANDDIAFSLVEELTKMEAVELLDDQALPGMASLDNRTAIFDLDTGGDEPLRIVLRQVKYGENQQERFLLAKRSDRKSVLRIRDDLVRRLPRNVNQLRYPYLAEIPADTVARIQIQSRVDPDVDLRRTRQGWKLLYASKQWPANEGRIERLLTALNSEPVIEYRSSTGARSKAYGLDRPLLTLSYTTSEVDRAEWERYQSRLQQAGPGANGGEELKKPEAEIDTETIRFGRGEDAFLNANFAGDPFIYAVDPSLVLSFIPSHPLKWRGLRLLDFRLLDVREISVSEAGGVEMDLFYNPLRNEWSGLLDGEPVDDEINPRLAERLAYSLGTLHAVDWLTDRREALRALERPSCEVRLRLASSNASGGGDPDDLQEVSFRLAPAVRGGRVPFYFGQFSDRPDVFLLDDETYAELTFPVLEQDL